jgi:hypothetical protein
MTHDLNKHPHDPFGSQIEFEIFKEFLFRLLESGTDINQNFKSIMEDYLERRSLEGTILE